MGSTMAKDEIAQFNQDYDVTCDYCLECPATAEHIKWGCSFWEPKRKEIDEGLAAIPRRYLPECVKCAIAPAMKLDGERTYWGARVDEDETKKVKELLGVDMTLHKPGRDAEETEKREMAMEIVDEMSSKGINARRTMLAYKGAHGTGINPTFPNKQDIEENMRGLPEDFMVEVFGDGSYTTPKKGWAAIGGQGIWIKDWNLPDEQKENRKEEDIAEPALGQVGSSTRQELAAWVIVLTKPYKSRYATDSASMLGKAMQLIKAAEEIEDKERRGIKVFNRAKPFKKAWGLQRDGDLWELAWKAILARGAANQTLRKVKRPCDGERHRRRKEQSS